MTNYAVLIYAVAYFLHGEAPPLNSFEGKAGLTAIVAIVWTFSIFVCGGFRKALQNSEIA